MKALDTLGETGRIPWTFPLSSIHLAETMDSILRNLPCIISAYLPSIFFHAVFLLLTQFQQKPETLGYIVSMRLTTCRLLHWFAGRRRACRACSVVFKPVQPRLRLRARLENPQLTLIQHVYLDARRREINRR